MINLGTEITSYSTVQDLTNVSDLRQSGLYLLNIKSATYKKTTTESNTYEIINLTCLAYNASSKGAPLGKVRFNLFIPGRDATHLAFFLGYKNETGYYLPDPRHFSGTSQSGKDYDFYSIPDLAGKSVFAMLEYQGESASRTTGKTYPLFRLVSFCDQRAFSAYDIVTNAQRRSDYLQEFINTLSAEKNAQDIQRMQSQQAQHQNGLIPF